MVIQVVINCQPLQFSDVAILLLGMAQFTQTIPLVLIQTPNLVAQARPLELVAVPLWIEGTCFLDMKIHTINRIYMMMCTLTVLCISTYHSLPGPM